MPEAVPQKVLEFARTLTAEADKQVWQPYLASEQERQEVYQRLADFLDF